MPLTGRELEITRLVADGMTTRELAAKLFISERTVEAHVANSLNKLGPGSRIQLAAWVAGWGEARSPRWQAAGHRLPGAQEWMAT